MCLKPQTYNYTYIYKIMLNLHTQRLLNNFLTRHMGNIIVEYNTVNIYYNYNFSTNMDNFNGIQIMLHLKWKI